jgi:hypothetical protein
VLPVWLYQRTAAFLISFDLKGTLALIVRMPMQDDNPGKAAVVATANVLFFKNVRLLSMSFHLKLLSRRK